ncbi:hypothetical protein C4566_01980 [Candidatus Parcubacteria bacterium]|nr:MAG: hypothetical protein C4566_01980 [Candidatus Parcubacteria bacterium]
MVWRFFVIPLVLIFTSKNGILKVMSYEYKWPIYGHKNLLNFLQETISQNKLANTYLFYGPRGLGKKLTVKYFAKSLFCEDKHLRPCGKCQSCRLTDKNSFLDLYTLGKDQELSAENIREFLHKLSLSNVSGDKKLAIIYGIDTINLYGANALLKTLEEPPRNTTIILVADSLANLPATVMSRCQLLKFTPLKLEDMKQWLENYNLSELEKETIINLSFGRPGIALNMMGDDLENFKKSCNFIVKLLSGSTFYFMQTIDKWFSLLKKENPGAKLYELGALTGQYLDLFEIFLRDLLWVKLNRPVVNTLYETEIKNMASSFSKEILLENLLKINIAKQKIKHNVSPQILWENLLLSVK